MSASISPSGNRSTPIAGISPRPPRVPPRVPPRITARTVASGRFVGERVPAGGTCHIPRWHRPHALMNTVAPSRARRSSGEGSPVAPVAGATLGAGECRAGERSADVTGGGRAGAQWGSSDRANTRARG